MPRSSRCWKEIEKATAHAEEPPPDKSWLGESKSKEAWDRTVSLKDDEIKAIGLETTPVLSQTEPTVLSLFGTTDYDPATVTTIRLMFDSRIDKVLVNLGSVVRKGDPLLELFSADLAAAKSDYELAVSQWNHDLKVLTYKTPLAREDTLPKKELLEVENDEAQSRLKMKLAKDKLLVYGLTEKEIQAAKDEDGQEKARMTLRAWADGVVVKRDVVNGNYYDSSTGTALLTIAPLDHLWVRGGVSELDADKVELGQEVKVILPFAVADPDIKSKIEYIEKAIDPDTRAAKFRTTIPNTGGRFKAGAFVKVQVKVRPRQGQTVIPRSAMVSVGSTDYVFIRRPAARPACTRSSGGRSSRPRRATTSWSSPSRPRATASWPRRARRDARQPDPRADVRGPADGRGGPAGLDRGQQKLDRFHTDHVMVHTSP